MPELTPRLISAVKGFEGFRPVPYKDPVGKWTWGYGETRGPMPERWTESEADLALRAGLTQAQHDVLENVKVALTVGQLDACTDFVYNLGIGNFENSTLLKKVNSEDWPGAYFEFGRWVHAGGQILPGLVKRRTVEQQWFLEG